MEGQEYLNQISASNRPEKKSMKGIFSSKFFIVGMIGVVGLILILILGAILSGGKEDTKTSAYELKLHLDNVAEVVSSYQPNIKSSDLRSSSASLYSILTNTSRDLTDYLTEEYNFKEKDIERKIITNATEAKEQLEAELFRAKINGILDRIYAHKMAYELSVLMSEEAKIIDMSKNDNLKEFLTSSYNSLGNLYTNFNDFSETN